MGVFSQGPSRKVGREDKAQYDLVGPPHFVPRLDPCVTQPVLLSTSSDPAPAGWHVHALGFCDH